MRGSGTGRRQLVLPGSPGAEMRALFSEAPALAQPKPWRGPQALPQLYHEAISRDMDARFAQAIEAFRAVSAQDPVALGEGAAARPRELVQAEQLVAWVALLEPHASQALQLAAHCQHIGRFQVPRESYPAGRSGYLRWRADLGRRHAETAESILRAAGYEAELIEAVRRIVSKQNRSSDADVQTMEDALCLSFLQHEFGEFAGKHDDDKLIRILRKTWGKMSERAHTLALQLPLDARCLGLVQRALNGNGS
ncbi:MAG: DUF4202 domain-containing protein [Polyangiaceae bacterium]